MDTIVQTVTRSMSWPEIIASVTGMLCVWLAARTSLWTWFWGTISVSLFGYVFYRSRLYSNAGLQLLYFLPMQFYGWWSWTRGTARKTDDLPITLLSDRSRAAWLGGTVALAAALGTLTARYTDAALPYWDAAVTAMSIVAQFLLARKVLENWALWIVIDLVCIFYFYPSQKLYVTTGLYVIYLVLSVMGLIEWTRTLRKGAGRA